MHGVFRTFVQVSASKGGIGAGYHNVSICSPEHGQGTLSLGITEPQ